MRRMVTGIIVAVLVVAFVVTSRPVRQPALPRPGPPPIAAVLETGMAGDVPVQRHHGSVPVVTDPDDLRIAVSSWVAFRLAGGVLDDAASVLSPPDSRLRVRFVVRTLPTRSTLSITGAGLQVGRCGGYHGLAFVDVGEPLPDTNTAPVVGGRVYLCGDTYRLDHDQQVALVVHETAHLLGLGHVCESHACRGGDPPGCTHLMAGRWWYDCAGAVDLTTLEASLRELYPPATRG